MHSRQRALLWVHVQALSWSFYALSQHPEWQEAILREAEQVGVRQPGAREAGERRQVAWQEARQPSACRRAFTAPSPTVICA